MKKNSTTEVQRRQVVLKEIRNVWRIWRMIRRPAHMYQTKKKEPGIVRL